MTTNMTPLPNAGVDVDDVVAALAHLPKAQSQPWIATLSIWTPNVLRAKTLHLRVLPIALPQWGGYWPKVSHTIKLLGLAHI